MKIPYVKAKDSESDNIVEGFYFEYPETTYCFTEDYEREPKVKLIPCVMAHRMTDWGLPNVPIICKPIDKSTLKIIGYIDTDNDIYIPTNYVIEKDIKCVDCDECSHRSEDCLCDISENDEDCPLANNGWIPCSRELPNVGITVLCYWQKYSRYDNTTSYYYTLMHRNEYHHWISDVGMCTGKVIAWQPLPAPYKEGGSDE